MKGISTIIAAIILVVITIGLIATAYLYFAGIVSAGPVLALSSGYCNATRYMVITIRNDGTTAFNTANDITAIEDGAAKSCTWTTAGDIAPGKTTTCTFTTQSTAAMHDVSIIGPRNQVGGSITC